MDGWNTTVSFWDGLFSGECFQKYWYPQIIHFNRFFHYFHHPFSGPTPIFGNIQVWTVSFREGKGKDGVGITSHRWMSKTKQKFGAMNGANGGNQDEVLVKVVVLDLLWKCLMLGKSEPTNIVPKMVGFFMVMNSMVERKKSPLALNKSELCRQILGIVYRKSGATTRCGWFNGGPIPKLPFF